MADVYITFSGVDQAGGNDSAAIIQGDFARSEVISSSGTSAASTLTAINSEVCLTVTTTTTAVAVKTGDGTPTATVADGAIVGAGGTQYFTLKAGQKVAVIDV